MHDDNALGDYLRARRELVRPADVGIRSSGLRRVAGLRREEVAMLAGVSADYYLRLEQGRDRNPSLQVLEALAGVLQLDRAATTYLVSLAAGRPRAASRPRVEKVPTGILQLIDSLPQPAFVEGRAFDVLAVNALATAVSPNLVVGRNRLRDYFLDERERELYDQWERSAAGMVAGFRIAMGTETADPRFVQLVGELSIASEPFRRLWARHDVVVREGGPTVLHHPEVGDLLLRREKLAVTGTDGIVVAIYHAERGSKTEELLSLLGSMAAPATTASAPPLAPAPTAATAAPSDRRPRGDLPASGPS